jgi:predicted nucleic acid-binding protein
VTFVLDNSVAVAWCFEDEQTPPLLDLLERVAESGAFAPTLWPLEAINALLVAERRGRLERDRRRSLCGFLKALPITLDSETAIQTWTATAAFAERFGLSAYDAAYLELAERLDLPLASLDADLRRAADALGRPLLGSGA